MKRVSVLAALALALCVGVPSVAAAPPKVANVVAAPATVHVDATPGVSVVSTSVWTLDDGDTFIDGEVVNTFAVPVTGIVVTASAIDASGKVIATEHDGTFAYAIDPGQKAPFILELTKPGTTYKVSVTSFAPSNPANRKFTITGASTSVDDEEYLHITGTIQNDNAGPAEKVTVVAVFRDAAGKEVASDWMNIGASPHTLAAGQSATFDLKTYPGEYATYEIWGDAASDPLTNVSLFAMPSDVVAGGSASLHGVAQAGEQVTFQRYTGSAWTDIPGLTATADSTGAFSTTLKGIAATVLVQAVAPSGTSAGQTITVSAVPTFKASATSVKRGAPVVLSGSVKPSLAGTLVTIERKVGSKWVKVATVKLSASSTFTYRWVPKVAGTYVLRATVPGVGVTLGGSSASKTIKVK